MRSGELDTMSTGNDAELRGLVDRLERLQTSLPQDTAEEIKTGVDEACREAARIQATFAGQACLADEEGSASTRDEPGRLRKVGAYLVSLIVVAGVVVGVALLNRFGATGRGKLGRNRDTSRGYVGVWRLALQTSHRIAPHRLLVCHCLLRGAADAGDLRLHRHTDMRPISQNVSNMITMVLVSWAKVGKVKRHELWRRHGETLMGTPVRAECPKAGSRDRNFARNLVAGSRRPQFCLKTFRPF